MHASQQHGLWSKCLSRERAHAPATLAYTMASYTEQSIAQHRAQQHSEPAPCCELPVPRYSVAERCTMLLNLIRCTPVNTMMSRAAAPWHAVTHASKQTLGQERSAMTASYIQ
jgi:hypothetical protein